MFGSVCWGKISKSDRGKLKQIAKKEEKKHPQKAGYMVGKLLGSFKNHQEKRLQKTNANIKQSYTLNETLHW